VALRKVLFFMLVSANGYYERGPWEIDWHTVDAEFNDFAEEQLDSVDAILFGRRTYEGMAAYWPTPEAIGTDPGTARRMNEKPKIVFSKTLDRADWSNTRLVRGDAVAEVRKLKDQPGRDVIIFGSSDLSASLATAGLVDEFRLMVCPIALASGKPLFAGVSGDVRLALRDVRRFGNGNVLLAYTRA
jgi:dihydrofolate reductase